MFKGLGPGASIGNSISTGSNRHGIGSGDCSDKACFENKNNRRAPDRSVDVSNTFRVDDDIEVGGNPSGVCGIAPGSSSKSPNRKAFCTSSDCKVESFGTLYGGPNNNI